tara:strand:+ start:1266 stop:1460 length:195 start_codon:yes stop_codon:yes gene_type:complete
MSKHKKTFRKKNSFETFCVQHIYEGKNFGKRERGTNGLLKKLKLLKTYYETFISAISNDVLIFI